MQSKALCKQYVNFGLSNSNDNNYYHYIEDQFFGCRALWRAVIMQAIFDLTSNSSRTEEKLAKIHAKSWLLGNSRDFLHVCTMAEYDHEFVKKKALSTIENYERDPKKMRFFYTKLKKIFNAEEKNRHKFDEEDDNLFNLDKLRKKKTNKGKRDSHK